MIVIFENYNIYNDVEDLIEALIKAISNLFHDVIEKDKRYYKKVDISYFNRGKWYQLKLLYKKISSYPDEVVFLDIVLEDQTIIYLNLKRVPWNDHFEEFYDYLRFLLEKYNTKTSTYNHQDPENIVYKFNPEDIKKYISNLNTYDYEIFIDAQRYNL